MPIPLSVEVIIGVLAKCLIPLSVEVIVVWLSSLSLLCEMIVVVPCLLCEVIVVVPYFLCRGCFVGERSCVLLVCICQILSGSSLCGKSCVDAVSYTHLTLPTKRIV